MPAATLDLTGDRIIEQGSRFSLLLRYPGNVVSSRLRGQIRRSAALSADLLAEFQFLNPSFDPATNRTSWQISLRSQITERMPATTGTEFWRYDILIQLPGEPDVQRLLQGRVAVSAGVTDV